MKSRSQYSEDYRVLPHNVEAEQALLGAILVNNKAFHAVSGFLSPSDFFEVLHQRIFEVCSNLIMKDAVANPVTVKSALPEDVKVGSSMTVAQYIARLATEAVSIINAEGYGRLILDLSTRRSFISLGEQMVIDGYDSSLEKPTADLIDDVEEEIFQISLAQRERGGGGSFSGPTIASKYLDMVTADPLTRSQNGVPIGLKEIGVVLSESVFEATNLVGILSSSGEGKTSLFLDLVRAGVRNGNPILILSYDQSGLQIVSQMAAQEFGIETRLQRSGSMTDPQIDKTMGYMRSLAGSPFEIINCSSTKDTASKLSAYIKRFIKKHGNGKTPLVAIDHAGTIKSEREDRSSDEGTRARNNAQVLKDCAKMTGAAILLLMQRPSAGLKRFNPRPTRQDVYGGQAALQPFDSIFYLYRAEYHMDEQLKMASDTKEADKIRLRFAQQYGDDIEGTAEIGAVKVRFGNPSIRRKVRFVAEYTRYESIYRPIDDDQGAFL